MPDYKNAKIYKLWSPEGDDLYIGSTTQPLYARLSEHKKKRETCTSKILFEKYDDVRIELIESFPCENKDELNKREGEYIRNNICVNKVIAGRTKEEYYEDNKEKLKEYMKEYDKEYYKNNKEKIKEYQENNKQKIKEYMKEYREKNDEKIKEYKKEKYTCQCGRIINIGDKARHERTQVHQLALGGAPAGAAFTSCMAC